MVYNTSQHRGTFICKCYAVKEEESTREGMAIYRCSGNIVAGGAGILVGGVQVCSCKENPYTHSPVALAIIRN